MILDPKCDEVLDTHSNWVCLFIFCYILIVNKLQFIMNSICTVGIGVDRANMLDQVSHNAASDQGLFDIYPAMFGHINR